MKIEFDQSQDFDVGFTTEQAESVSFEQDQGINVSLDGVQMMEVAFAEDTFHVDFGTTISEGEYQGAYEVTPTTQTQILPTENKTLSQNIIVKPIPNNYGLITWNGSTLTVS